MRVAMSTNPGHGRPNEDFVGDVPGAVVLLDGAGILGSEHICRHGVAWYARSLGSALLANLTRKGVSDPVEALADSIEQVADQHRHTCDIADPSSPQATVATIRSEDDRADYLILADTFIALDPVDAQSRAMTDAREVTVRTECTSSLDGMPVGTAEYEQARLSAVSALRDRRNQPGGYWIAKDNPYAATEAVTGSVPLDHLRGAALLSNGASRIVDPYRLAGWPSVIEMLRTSGPDALLRRIRTAEADSGAAGLLPGFTSADDATVAYCDLSY